MATPLSVFKKAKNGTFARKRIELDPQIHIYLESVSQGERHKHIYMAAPLSDLEKKRYFFPEKGMELQADTT